MRGDTPAVQVAVEAPRGWGTEPALAGARPRPPRQLALEGMLGRLLVLAERAFIVGSLLIFSRAIFPALLETGAEGVTTNEGHPLLRAISGAIQLVALGMVVLRWRAVLAAASRNRLTLALVGLAVASAAWSESPDLTLRRGFALLGTTALGLYLVARFDTRTLLKLLAGTLGLAAVLSVVFSVGVPRIGVESGKHAGAWSGVFPSKNNLGQVMVLSTMVCVLVARQAERGRWLAWGGAALSVLLIVLSTSMTALGVLAISGVLALLYRAVRWHYTRAIPFAIAVLLAGGAVAVWLIAAWESVLASMGRDITLTGRIPLWEAVLARIAERPALGHGYTAFWTGWQGPAGDVWARVGWRPPHAHNGFLDLALDLGLVGLALFAAGFGAAFWRALVALRRTRSADAYWPLMFLTFLLFYNSTESLILLRNSIFWVLYVAVVASPLLHRTGAGERAEAAEPGGRAPEAEQPVPT